MDYMFMMQLYWLELSISRNMVSNKYIEYFNDDIKEAM